MACSDSFFGYDRRVWCWCTDFVHNVEDVFCCEQVNLYRVSKVAARAGLGIVGNILMLLLADLMWTLGAFSYGPSITLTSTLVSITVVMGGAKRVHAHLCHHGSNPLGGMENLLFSILLKVYIILGCLMCRYLFQN